MLETRVVGSLVGKRILVTRAREQASRLSLLLAERGAVPIVLPTIEFLPPPNDGAVDAAIRRLADYDWVVFTSVNGVRFFGEFLRKKGHEVKELATMRIAAIGPATAAALGELGLPVVVTPSPYVAEAVVEELRRFDLTGKRVLLPRALEARDVLAEGLSDQGAIVDVVPVYQTVLASDRSAARQVVKSGGLAAVTLTSSSTARNLVALLDESASDLLSALTIATIGPITSQTARELGLTVQVEAPEHTIPGLVVALERYFEG